MGQASIVVEDRLLKALRALADARRQSVETLVCEAVDAYLREQNEAKGDGFDQVLQRIRPRIPPTLTPEEIEADITEAHTEYRQERRRARGG